MKVNAGIVTTRLEETKVFYREMLGFGVTFENEFYLLLHTPGRTSEVSFLLPNHPSQQSPFHKPFQGEGVYLTVEVENVDSVYKTIKAKGVPIMVELRDEPWGDRHFAIRVPNGVAVDIVTFTSPEAP
jgi:catechol 2,3-dioxygenase-like lactoylglutathione lyase family enzyme